MDIFLIDQSTTSGRYAVFEDDGISGWLYLTEAGETKPVADCWIYNRIPAPDPKDIDQYKNGPPPASSDYSKDEVQVTHSEGLNISFVWSGDGNSVALLIDDTVMGFIQFRKKFGWSRNLKCSGPWGDVFDEQLFAKIFGRQG